MDRGALTSKAKLRLVAGVLLLLAVSLWTTRDIEVDQVLSGFTVPVLILILLAQVLYAASDGVRYRLALGWDQSRKIGLVAWLRLFATGRLLNQLVPQAGNAYRAIELKRRWSIPAITFVTSVVVMGLFVNSLALAIVGVFMMTEKIFTGLLIVAIGVTVVFAALMAAFWSRKAATSTRLPNRFALRIEAASTQVMNLAAEPRYRWQLIGWSMLTSLLGIAVFAVNLYVLTGQFDPVAGAVLYLVTTIGTVVALTPSGLGISELIAALTAGLVGVPASAAVLSVLMVRLTGIAGLGVLMAYCWLSESTDGG